MRATDAIGAVRREVCGWRRAGQRIALVATMGNLHDGHLSLVRAAAAATERVVATIFVNPLQFGADEDYASYPRTLATDRAALQSTGCDLLFAPPVGEMYPDGASATRLSVGALGDTLCGAHRVGHFDGMATVVVKLLNIVQPDVALFGQKDYQQLVVIRRVVRDLNLPVQIEGLETVREADGLAMSSRNRYLDASERAVAPLLHQTLGEVAAAIRAGRRDFTRLSEVAVEKLVAAGFRPDYVAVRAAADLSEPDSASRKLVVLAAAVLGKARLIDNVQVEIAAAGS